MRKKHASPGKKKLDSIEENTYYYNIFGTDKEHVITDAKRVFSPEGKNKVVRLVSMFNKFAHNTFLNAQKIRI